MNKFSVDTPAERIQLFYDFPGCGQMEKIAKKKKEKHPRRKLIKRFINFYIMSTHIIRHNVSSSVRLLCFSLSISRLRAGMLVCVCVCVSYPVVLYLSPVVYFLGSRTHMLPALTCRPFNILSRLLRSQLMTKAETKVRRCVWGLRIVGPRLPVCHIKFYIYTGKKWLREPVINNGLSSYCSLALDISWKSTFRCARFH